jgi:hypothetical protein
MSTANTPPSELQAVALYNPTVRSATLRGARRTGVGAERLCGLGPKGRVVERVTHWEEGHALGLEVIESDRPLHPMRWVTRLKRDGHRTRLTHELEYRVKFGPIGWLLDRLVMGRKWTATLDDVLGNLVRAAERGAQAPGGVRSAVGPGRRVAAK